jgi:hypothetical protein
MTNNLPSDPAIKKVKELIAVLDPYANNWHAWIESGACFLSKDEISIVCFFLMTGSHNMASQELNIPVITVSHMLDKISFRLNSNQGLYQRWLTEHQLEQQGIVNYTSQTDRFLNSPLAFLKLPYDLKRRLKYLNEETMAGVLNNYTEKELSESRFFNDKSLRLLKLILKENDCEQLLK